MKKNIILSIVTICTILLLTGCGKTKVDVAEFKEAMRINGFNNIEQVTENLSPDIVEMYSTNKGDDYIIEFITYANDGLAEKAYDSRKATYDNIRVKKTFVDISSFNYDRFSLTSDGRFFYLCRVDNTILIVLTSESKKKDAEGIIKELGY